MKVWSWHDRSNKAVNWYEVWYCMGRWGWVRLRVPSYQLVTPGLCWKFRENPSRNEQNMKVWSWHDRSHKAVNWYEVWYGTGTWGWVRLTIPSNQLVTLNLFWKFHGNPSRIDQNMKVWSWHDRSNEVVNGYEVWYGRWGWVRLRGASYHLVSVEICWKFRGDPSRFGRVMKVWSWEILLHG